MTVLAVSIILVAAIVLLVTEALPIDQTALEIIVALLVTGILMPGEAIAGFANPAPITIGVLFVVSEGLIRTGSLDFLTRRIMRYSGGSPRRLLLVRGTAPQLAQILESRCARLVRREDGPPTDPHDTSSIIIDLLVQPNSDAVEGSIPRLMPPSTPTCASSASSGTGSTTPREGARSPPRGRRHHPHPDAPRPPLPDPRVG